MIASANSFNVLRSAGAPSTNESTAAPIAVLRFETSVEIADVRAAAAVASAPAFAALAFVVASVAAAEIAAA